MEMLGKQIKKKSFQRNKDDEDSWHTFTLLLRQPAAQLTMLLLLCILFTKGILFHFIQKEQGEELCGLPWRWLRSFPLYVR